MKRSWLLLAIAVALEVVWATAAGASHGFTRPLPTLVVLLAMPPIFGLLAVITARLPAGTVYALWTGLGAAGTAVLGIVGRGDPVSGLRLLGLALVVGGVAILRTADRTTEGRSTADRSTDIEPDHR